MAGDNKKRTIDEDLSNPETKKPKKTKSRNGCVTCKKRRLKCDETKPFCMNCIKKGIVCGGYAINFKWRDFSETSSSNKIPNFNNNTVSNIESNPNTSGKKITQQNLNPNKSTLINSTNKKSNTDTTSTSHQHTSTSNNSLQKALEEATLSVTGKSTQEIAIANVLIANGKNPELAATVASTLSGLVNSDDILELVSKKGIHNLKNDSVETLIKAEQSPDDIPISIKSGTNPDKGVTIKEEETSENDEFGQPNFEVDITNIQPNKLLNEKKKNVESYNILGTHNNNDNNNNNNNNTLLHSLADIASKVPASPIAPPLSPFNEPFPSDAFVQRNRKNSVDILKLQQQQQNDPTFNKIANNQPTYKKDSPLNLFKETPQPSVYSPTFPKSPNISSILAHYSQSNAPTPKFEELDSYQNIHLFSKFPPVISDTTSHQQDKNNTSSDKKDEFPNSKSNSLKNNVIPMSPPIFNLLSLANSDSTSTAITNFSNFSSTTDNTHHTENNDRLSEFAGVGASPIFEIETPKPGTLTNPNSPYTTILNYINSTQLPEKAPKPDEKNDKPIDETNSIVPLSLNNNSAPSTPGSVYELNSPLDIFENPNRPPILLHQNPVNLYALHLSDENLSTLVAFDQYTCGIMSIKNGPTENPWRSFLLPMSIDHPVVRSALLAMTCFHIARGDPAIRSRGVNYMKDAIVTLVHSLSSDSSRDKNKKIKDSGDMNSIGGNELIKRTPPDVALATCLALAMGEAWDRHISTGIAHLKGAKSMIIRVLNKLEKRSRKKRSKNRRNSSISLDSSNISEFENVEDMVSNKIEVLSNSDTDNENISNIQNSSNNNDEKVINDNEDDDEFEKRKLPKELQFLVNAWMYFDVLARMTSENDDEFSDDDTDDSENSDDPDNTDNADRYDVLQDNSNHEHDESTNTVSNNLDDKNASMKKSLSQNNITSPGSNNKNINSSGKKKKTKRSKNDSSSVIAKFRNFNLEDGDQIDPLLGVAQTLFPIMSDVATLIEHVRRAKTKNKSSIDTNMKTPLRLISRTVELKTAIERWKVPTLSNMANSTKAEDPTFDLNAAVATAEAYRYAVLLYLHQAVPEVPSQSSHSLAENVLMLLASVPMSSRTIVTHLFPLFVASCEARPGEEREWARERWLQLIEQMWIGTIERAWEVVKEVWARKDAFSAQKSNNMFTGNELSTDIGSSNGNLEQPDFISADGNKELEYNKAKRRISRVVHGNDEDLIDDEDNKIGSWTHWTTVMKEWGWEVLLA